MKYISLLRQLVFLVPVLALADTIPLNNDWRSATGSHPRSVETDFDANKWKLGKLPMVYHPEGFFGGAFHGPEANHFDAWLRREFVPPTVGASEKVVVSLAVTGGLSTDMLSVDVYLNSALVGRVMMEPDAPDPRALFEIRPMHGSGTFEITPVMVPGVSNILVLNLLNRAAIRTGQREVTIQSVNLITGGDRSKHQLPARATLARAPVVTGAAAETAIPSSNVRTELGTVETALRTAPPGQRRQSMPRSLAGRRYPQPDLELYWFTSLESDLINVPVDNFPAWRAALAVVRQKIDVYRKEAGDDAVANTTAPATLGTVAALVRELEVTITKKQELVAARARFIEQHDAQLRDLESSQQLQQMMGFVTLFLAANSDTTERVDAHTIVVTHYEEADRIGMNAIVDLMKSNLDAGQKRAGLPG